MNDFAGQEYDFAAGSTKGLRSWEAVDEGFWLRPVPERPESSFSSWYTSLSSLSSPPLSYYPSRRWPTGGVI